MRKLLSAVSVIALVLLMAGCAANAEDQVSQKCIEGLQYAIESTVDKPGNWLGSETETSDIHAQQREAPHAVFLITGTATVTTPQEDPLTVEFECFGQVVDGKAYGSVNKIDGRCTPRAREVGHPDC